MSITKVKKVALKGEMTYWKSHSWEVVKPEFKFQWYSSRVYTLNHNTILIKNWLQLGIGPREKNKHIALDLERILKII